MATRPAGGCLAERDDGWTCRVEDSEETRRMTDHQCCAHWDTDQQAEICCLCGEEISE